MEIDSSARPVRDSSAADRALRGLAALFVAMGCALRFFRIEADQDFYGWWGHIFDEGRWSEHARELVLRHQLPVELGHNAFVAPLHEVATTIVFWLGGVSFATARLFPALCGCALVVLIWHWLRTRVDAAALVLGVALVAFPADLVVLSRLAVPESGAMLGATITVLLLCTRPPTPQRMFIAGLAAAVMVGLKLTAIFVVPALLGVAFTLGGPTAGLADRWRDARWFLAGIALPATIIAIGAALVVGFLDVDLPSRLDRWSGFLILRGPYEIVSLPFLAIDSTVISSTGLALWLAGIGYPSRHACSEDESRWYRATLCWALLWILVFALQGYFPSYYRVHVLVPLALVAALSATRLARTGLGPLRTLLSDAQPAGRIATTGFVAFVLAAQLAAVCFPLASRLGADPERLSTRLSALTIAITIITAALFVPLRRPRVLAFVVAFSIATSVLYFAHWILDPYRVGFFLVSPADVVARLALLALAALIAWRMAIWTSHPGRQRLPAVAVACVSSVAWLIHLGPGLITPTYTLRDFSIALGELHPADQPIWSHRTMTAFIANRLEYQRLHTPEHQIELPQTIVTDLPLREDDGTLEARYELVRAFEVHVPEHHTTPPPESPYCSGHGQCFGLFRLIGPPPDPPSDAED